MVKMQEMLPVEDVIMQKVGKSNALIFVPEGSEPQSTDVEEGPVKPGKTATRRGTK
jgi:hypothetical protein